VRTVVVVPTYNERDNIGDLVETLIGLPDLDLHVLVVDDDSPDGTPRVVEERFRGDHRVHLLLRRDGRGRGRAGRAGFLRSLELGADAVVEMDADFSHDPHDVPRLVAELAHADVIVGSRRVDGGGAEGRSRRRRWLTRAAHAFIRSILGVPVLDCTSGFRCFTRGALERIDPRTLLCRGPAIVEEVLFKARRRSLRIREVPITFRDRTRGRSKLRIRTVAEVGLTVLGLRLLALIRRV
jgi:dolichol-phosphate mannosyltransferase